MSGVDDAEQAETVAPGSGSTDLIAADTTLAAGAASDPASDPAPSSRIRKPPTGLAVATVDPLRYVIREELARGGMGRVSLAEDRALGRTVAIKEVLTPGPEYAARFERELALTARLQHPGIVTIHDGGRWTTGELVYIMRLVSGDSLEVRIGRCATVADRIALVPNAIAAVNALAYAHSQGIIHRDLKPANILIGDFGETVVIDWGLAKDLRTPTADTAPSSGGISNSSVDTIVGDVLGTPAYMAPEQAHGGDVDERADVYALGAVLYHLLSGRPPYRGRSAEVLAAALVEPPPDLGDVSLGMPPDLLAIVKRAMASAPVDRYATAAELGAELQRFQNGQLVATHHYTTAQLFRRWLHKRRAPIAVAMIAFVALGIGAVVSVRSIIREQAQTRDALALAEHNRGEADRRGAEAERLVDFMVLKLHDQLEPVGKLDLLQEVAETIQRYYQSQPGSGTVDDLRKRARARRNLGNVLTAKGDTSGALAEYEASVATLNKQLEIAPNDQQLQLELVASYVAVGNVRASKGELPTALDLMQRANALGDQLHAREPADRDRSRLLVLARLGLGRVQERKGELGLALASYREGQALARELAASRDDITLHNLVTAADDNIGDVLRSKGEVAAALAEYRDALALDAAAVAKHPDDVTLQDNLWRAYLKIGDVLHDRDDNVGAIAMYRPALTLAKALVARDPENALWQRAASVGYLRMGDALATPETATDALAAYRAAREIRERLVAKDPGNVEWQRDQLVAQIKVATMLEGTDQLAAAFTEYDRARVTAERLGSGKVDATSVRDLVHIYSGLGRVLTLQKDIPKALRWLRAGQSTAEQVLALPASDVRADDYWAVELAHEMTAEALLEQHDVVGADAEYAQAAHVSESRVIADAEDPRWKAKVAELVTLRARCCKRR